MYCEIMRVKLVGQGVQLASTHGKSQLEVREPLKMGDLAIRLFS